MITPLQLALGSQPNVSHFHIFGCVVYVPIAPPQRSKLGPQRRPGIYVGFNFPSIICYLEPVTGDVFTTRFAYYHFDENVFPPLRGDKSKEWRDITWYVPFLSHFDPCTRQCELEVQRIVHLQGLANQLPDAFTDIKKVTKSHVLVVNASTHIDVPEGKLENAMENESKTRLKRGRPIDSKDLIPRKKNEQHMKNLVFLKSSQI